jgi:DNA-binding response OmpR family regulator
MENTITILIVEDETNLRHFLATALSRQGYSVLAAENGAQAIRLLAAHPVHLMLLDIRLPHMDGFAVCQEVRRRSGVPIILLSALQRPQDVVYGLELGADEYITKPFQIHALLARLHAVLRRTAVTRGQPGFSLVRRGNVVLNAQGDAVFVESKEVPLTPTECKLLRYLMLHADRPVQTTTLLQEVWGYAAEENLGIVHTTVHQDGAGSPDAPLYRIRVGCGL